MSKLIVTPPASLERDPELRQNVIQALRSKGLGHNISILDPFHPRLSPSEQCEVLKVRYEQQLTADGLESGHFVLNGEGEVAVAISQPLPNVAGFIFEAFTVRTFNEKKDSIGKKAFLWATEKSKVTSAFLEQFHAVGVGFRSTESLFPQLYNPTLRQFDVIFYRMNPHRNEPEPAVVNKTTSPAGIQVKAITGNEKSEIIEPLLQRKYRRVLTYLRHRDGRLSYEACIELSRSLYRESQISQKDLQFLEEAIASPERIGIDQREVDEYYRYIHAWYQQQAARDEIILSGLGIQITEEKYRGSLITTLTT